MNITTITRSLDKTRTSTAYADVRPDMVRTLAVRTGENAHLLSEHPLTAGNEFHALLKRMGDKKPLSPTEKAYLPWLATLRNTVRSLGVWKMEAESNLNGKGVVPSGACDLLAKGGPATVGVIEVKVIVSGTIENPRGRDLAQLGSYARLVAGRDSFDNAWAALAYVELETHLVRLFVYKSARPLIMQTLDLLRGE